MRSNSSPFWFGFLFIGFAVIAENGVPKEPPDANKSVSISSDGASVEVRADAMPELSERLNEPGRVSKLVVRPHGRVRPDLRILAKLSGLQTLSLAGVAIDDDDLPLIVALPALESLNLSLTPISDKGVADNLWKCTRLKELTITSSRLSNASLPFIGKMHALRRLTLGGPKIERPFAVVMPGQESYADLAALDKLEILDLRGADVRDSDLIEFSKLDSLREIRLNWADPSVTIEGLYALQAKSTKLRIGSEVLGRLRADFQTNQKGQITAISNADIQSLERLARVEDMSAVEFLSLEFCPTRALALGFPNVRRLEMRNVRLDAKHVDAFVEWKSLEELQVESSSVDWSEADVKKLGRIKISGLRNSTVGTR
jgi:hypothetical protein